MGQETRRQGRERRHERVRERIRGSAGRPRLAVFRSISHIYAQLIDDESGRTLVAASSLDVRPSKAAAPPDQAPPKAEQAEKGGKTELARMVGRALGERAKASGIAEAVFDRGGYRYHGRVKALGEAARGAGLRF